MFKFSLKGVPVLEFIVIVFAFLFVDLFDTIGTLIGVSAKADMLDSREDSCGSRARSLQTRSVRPAVPASVHPQSTTFVESASGVTEGGKNRSYILDDRYPVPAILVLISDLPCNPSFATAPALIVVGFYMIGSVSEIDFNDPAEGIPAFLCIIAMPFFYASPRESPWELSPMLS